MIMVILALFLLVVPGCLGELPDRSQHRSRAFLGALNLVSCVWNKLKALVRRDQVMVSGGCIGDIVVGFVFPMKNRTVVFG